MKLAIIKTSTLSWGRVRRTRCLIPAGADAPVAPVLTAALLDINIQDAFAVLKSNCNVHFNIFQFTGIKLYPFPCLHVWPSRVFWFCKNWVLFKVEEGLLKLLRYWNLNSKQIYICLEAFENTKYWVFQKRLSKLLQHKTKTVSFQYPLWKLFNNV